MRALIPKLARAAAVLLVAQGVVIGVAVHSARGRVEDAMMTLGRQMRGWSRAEQLSDGVVRTIRLNGHGMRYVGSTVAEPVSAVLRAYERRCPSGATRGGDDEHGFVACTPDGGTLMSKLAGVPAVSELRYAYAERTERGTRVVALSSEGSLELDRMFPASGDAPGVDVANVPRPSGSRRTFQVREDGRSGSMTLYKASSSSQTPAALERWYRRSLASRGWTLLTTPSAEGAPHGLIAERGDRMLVVVLSDRRSVTTAAVLESPESPDRSR